MKTISTIFATLAALLMIALAARYVTGFWLFFTFASFQIQGAAIALGLCVLAFVFHRCWLNLGLATIALALGLHGYNMLDDFRQPQPLPPQDWPALFKLLSINIMGNNMANGARIADYIIASGADVVFIQESAPIGPEIPRIKAVYPYRLGCGAKTVTCDQSLWSKRPLVSGDVITASPIYRDRLMLASIDFNGTLVNFANVHLTKPYFDNFHEIELAKITEAITPIKGPLILAGDFNASILTPDIRRFLKNTGLMTAEREPNTIPVEAPGIGMAIDHVFVRDPLRFKSLVREADPLGSNHFGLIAEVFWQDVTLSYPPQ